MATKTSSKTTARKPAARKTAAAHKPTAPKVRASKKKLEPDAESATAQATRPAESRAQQPSPEKLPPQVAPAPRHDVESISLIEKKKPRKKAEDRDVKTKREVLPPISRIRASLETPAASPKPAAPVKVEPAPLPATEAPGVAVEGTIVPPAGAEVEPQNVIHIKPPIIVKQLSPTSRPRFARTTVLFSKKSAVKKAAVSTKSNKLSLRLLPLLLKRRRSSSPAVPSSRSWATLIMAKLRSWTRFERRA